MALIFFSGGESGTPDFTTNGLVTCSTAQVKTGTYSLYFVNTPGATLDFPSALTEFFFSCALYISSSGSPTAIVDFRNAAGTSVVSLRYNSSVTPWQLFVGANSVATGICLATHSAWRVIEIHVKIHSSNGLIHFRVNGLDDAIFAGNTASVSSSVTRFYSGTTGWGYHMDDLIINDTTGPINNSWMGGSRIVAIRPIGPGSLTQWTPSTGANWQCVDEKPISATDYVSSNIAGSIDLYDLASLPAGVCSLDSILGVKVFNSMSRSGVTTSYVQNALRTNSVNSFSSSFAVPLIDTLENTILDLNPITGLTWTYSDINALEVGVKLV